MKNRKVIMTEGKIYPKLLIFSIPLVIASIFQLTYNLFDYIILGWFSETKISSQAAVGVANPIMNIFLSLISGLCVGLAIHSSELYGKKDITNLKRQISSCLISGVSAILILTILFIALLNPILNISNVYDPSLRHQVYSYLLIISIGFIFSFIFNFYASVIRSFGDSYSSLLFLIISCVLNISFNILFVVGFKLDVLGVALSTTISQFISALLMILYSKIRYKEYLVLKRNEYVVDKELLKISSSYAIASALQQIVLFVGKYIISTQVNKYDAVTIDAFTSSTSIDQFFFAGAQNIGHASAIFIAQNKGAKNYSRAKKGFLAGLSINIVYGIIITLLLVIFRKEMLNLFISNEEAIQESKDLVISKGMLYVNIMCFLYLCPCVTNSIQSYFRGIGKLNIVFYSTFVQIIGRVLFSLILISTTNDPLSSTAYGTGIGWAFMISFELPFLITYWKTEKNLSN